MKHSGTLTYRLSIILETMLERLECWLAARRRRQAKQETTHAGEAKTPTDSIKEAKRHARTRQA